MAEWLVGWMDVFSSWNPQPRFLISGLQGAPGFDPAHWTLGIDLTRAFTDCATVLPFFLSTENFIYGHTTVPYTVI